MRPVEGVLIVVTVILLLFVQLNLQRFVVFRLMYERWAMDLAGTAFSREMLVCEVLGCISLPVISWYTGAWCGYSKLSP